MKYTILGSARSGTALAGLLKENNEEVFVSELNKISDDNKKYYNSIGVIYEEGGHSEKVLECDVIAISPGIPDTIKIVEEGVKNGKELTSEIEIAFRYYKGKTIAITGTNGKTTVTALTGFIFKLCNYESYTAGNIGTPFSSVARVASSIGICALEVSSFQLEHVNLFKPVISVILNITPDHLDRYVSFDEYANAKYNITKNQSENDIIILNYDDLKLKELIPNKGVKKLYFSLTNEVPIGAFLKNNKIFLKIENSEGIEFIEVIDVKDIFIIGSHNYANAMVAMLIAYSMKVPFEIICKGLKEFKGVSHRLEQVRKLKGVKYVNDSKATNVDATEVALKSFEEPIILIAGGISKKNNYDSIIELIKSRVKAVVLIGIASDEMNLAFEGITKIVKAGNELENALRIAQNIAEDGDVVLLSPACASFDMFNNYEHRGDVFKELVMNLK